MCIRDSALGVSMLFSRWPTAWRPPTCQGTFANNTIRHPTSLDIVCTCSPSSVLQMRRYLWCDLIGRGSACLS
eukprot:13505359-Alexandrium_andersonii.AAC.1